MFSGFPLCERVIRCHTHTSLSKGCRSAYTLDICGVFWNGDSSRSVTAHSMRVLGMLSVWISFLHCSSLPGALGGVGVTFLIISLLLILASVCTLFFARSFRRKLLLGLTVSSCILTNIVWILWLLGFFITHKMTSTSEPSSSFCLDWSMACVIPAGVISILPAVLVGVMPRIASTLQRNQTSRSVTQRIQRYKEY